MSEGTFSDVAAKLSHSTLQTNPDTYVNGIDPDETDMSHLIRIYTVCDSGLIVYLHSHLQQWTCPNSITEKSIS